MNNYFEWNIGKLYEIIPNTLFFTVHQNYNHTLNEITQNENRFYFTCKIHKNYIPYCLDFGPNTYEFC